MRSVHSMNQNQVDSGRTSIARKLSVDVATLRLHHRRLSATGASTLSLHRSIVSGTTAARLRARRASLACAVRAGSAKQAAGATVQLKSTPGPSVADPKQGSKQKTHAQKREEVHKRVMMAIVPTASEEGEWVQKRDAESGKTYFANLVTRETSWTNPTATKKGRNKMKNSKKKSRKRPTML